MFALIYFVIFIAAIFGLGSTDVADADFNNWLTMLLASGFLYVCQVVRTHALRIKPIPKRK